MVNVRRLFELIDAGKKYGAIAAELGISKSTVAWYRKRGGHQPKPTPRYDWQEVQRYYDAGHTRLQTIAHFRFAKATWDQARRRGVLSVTSTRPALETLLVANSKSARNHLKARLIKEGVLKNECALCGCPPRWKRKPLVLVLDHENGVNNDYRRENLRLLCPNCNSQTSTFAGRNVGRNKIPCGVTGSMADSDSVDPCSNQGEGTNRSAVVQRQHGEL